MADIHFLEHIYLLGTSHIARESVQDIKNAVKQIKPDMIGVELDRNRLHSLIKGQKAQWHPSLIRQLGLAGALFLLIGKHIQNKLGNIVGTQPGAEMLTAARLSSKERPLILLDRDVRITLSRFSKKFSFKEKMNLTKLLITAPFNKEKATIRLDLVPEQELVSLLMEKLQEELPSMYTVFVEERDRHMSAVILKARERYPDKKILCVVGTGHLPGMKRHLEKQMHNTFKLYNP